MAILVESVSTAAFTNATSLTITKPTGLAVGDLMVALLGSDEPDGFDTLSGWTSLVTTSRTSPGDQSENVQFKVADSGDVAASDFTFSPPDQATVGGGILRISGASTNFLTDTGTSTSSAAVYSGGVTPPSPDSLLIITAAGLFQGTTSGYNIATDDPTWTERFDINHSITTAHTLSCATSVRSAVTATGDFGLTWSASNSSDGIIINVESGFHATTTSTTSTSSTSSTTTSATSTSSTSSTTTSGTSTSSTSSTTTSATSTSSTTTSATSTSSSTSSTTTAFPFIIPDLSIRPVTPFVRITGSPD